MASACTTMIKLAISLTLISLATHHAQAGVRPGNAAKHPRDTWWQWQDGHATFYGGSDASGTMGGSCGFGNLYNNGYGTNTAALSTVLYNNGLSCGACFEIQCNEPRWCIPDKGSIFVAATNFCPPDWDESNKEAWCNPPLPHFDLSQPVFTTMALYVAGIVPVRYRRVLCHKSGGMRFTLNGNPWFHLVLVYNVAGVGDVIKVEMKPEFGEWRVMIRNWGQNWELHHQEPIVDQAISFRVTTSDSRISEHWNVIHKYWKFAQTYESYMNSW